RNIVHLILPEAPAGADRYARAAATLAAWRAEGVFTRDVAASVYVVAQDFPLPSGERRTRLGMFGSVRAEPFTTGRVRAPASAHADPAQGGAGAAGGVPEDRAELNGVRIRVWMVAGTPAERLAALAGRAQLYIADGHHRYETAVAYAQDHPEADRLLSFIVS